MRVSVEKNTIKLEAQTEAERALLGAWEQGYKISSNCLYPETGQIPSERDTYHIYLEPKTKSE